MAITKYDLDYKPVKRKLITFSGAVQVESANAARVVCLYKQLSGELIGSVLSNLSTGAWSIEVCNNTNVKYFAICLPVSGSRNAEVYAHLTGV